MQGNSDDALKIRAGWFHGGIWFKKKYPISMVVEKHLLQEQLFAGTLTRGKIYHYYMWKGDSKSGLHHNN